MGIGPLNGISMSAAIGGGVSGQDNMAVMQQLVAAIRAVNRGELETRGYGNCAGEPAGPR